MAILKILKDNDPALRKICRRVDSVTPHICRLLDDMRDTLLRADGVGLAAPQVGVLRRIVLVMNEEGKIYELINPEIIAYTAERQQEMEGCLSLPNRWGITDRPASVTVKAIDRTGKEYTVTGTGLTARCFCHELDHLDGILFPDKAIRMLTEEEIRQLQK